MKKVAFLALGLCWWASELDAQKARDSITVATEQDRTGSTEVAICCTPSERFPGKELCSYVWRRPAEGDNSFNLSIKILCDELEEKAPVVASESEWILALRGAPSQELFRVDCRSDRAWWIGPAAPAPPPPAPAPQPADPPASGGGKVRPAENQKLNNRLESMEKTLKEQKSAVQNLQEELGQLRAGSDGDVEKKLEAFRKEMLDRLQALEETHKNSCYRIDDEFKGQNEVMIGVAGSVLRFIKVKPRASEVPIGLSEAKAGELLAEAQGQSDRKIFPHIYLAVPEAVREVKPFYLQDRLIDAKLYALLTGGKDAARVSYQDVDRFIAELNARCNGRARFELPSEEQFVAAAQWRYDPVTNGLKPCDAVRKEDLRFEVTELLGQSWQLTRSLCQPFSEPPRMSCPDSSSYVRKGGAASSTSWLECMPEYRSPAPFDVSQKETSFRLALAE